MLNYSLSLFSATEKNVFKFKFKYCTHTHTLQVILFNDNHPWSILWDAVSILSPEFSKPQPLPLHSEA